MRLIKTVAEYIWLGVKNDIRSKSRTLTSLLRDEYNCSKFPSWNFDGSSTEQATGDNSEVQLKPQAVFPHPFKGYNFLVLCDTYTNTGKPHPTNTRFSANNLFDKYPEKKPLYGMEQEYFLIDPKTQKPLGFPSDGRRPSPQGQYYCSNGIKNSFGREVAEEHYHNCLQAGLDISGINAEVAPGQWEYQIGPCEGIAAGDHLWTSRFLMERITEKYGYNVDWSPKPIIGDWNGSGCHFNFDTVEMIQDGGYDRIEQILENMKKLHKEHMKVYGEGNENRMVGAYETANYNEFTYGVASRNTSVRIPQNTFNNKKGYIEDRRPSSNCDPYIVSCKLLESTIM